MGRKHTAGSAGYQGVGGVQVDNTTLSAADNQDITIDPSGTGIFKIAGDAQIEAQGDLRFADSDSSNYVGFQAPATVASNILWTLPAADGSANQLLTTNGSGTLSFSTASVTISDNTSDATPNYITFATVASGTITTARVSSTKLTFQPSTGTMSLLGNTTSTNSTSGTLIVTGGVGISENLNVGGSLSASSIAGVSGYVAITGGASLTDIDRKYIVSNTAGITLTLPATSTDGRTITIVDGNSFSSFNVTLGRNTKTIDGLSEDLVLNVAKSKVELVYRGGDWKVFIV
jgi:hypothetical protein